MKFKPGDKVVRTTKDCTMTTSSGTVTVSVGEVYTVISVSHDGHGIQVFPVARLGDTRFFSAEFFKKYKGKFIKRVRNDYVSTSRNK